MARDIKPLAAKSDWTDWQAALKDLTRMYSLGRLNDAVDRAGIATAQFPNIFQIWEIRGVAAMATGDFHWRSHRPLLTCNPWPRLLKQYWHCVEGVRPARLALAAHSC